MQTEKNPFAEDFPLPNELSLSRKYHWLMAFMHYPDCPLGAQAYFATQLIATELAHLKMDDDIQVTVGWLRALSIAPALDDRSKIDGKRFKDGLTAGWILALIYAMHIHGIDRPSINKAVDILESLKIPPLHSERTKIFNAWRLMRPVSHLWGTMALLEMTDTPPNVSPGEEGLAEFLKWTASLFEFSCCFAPSNMKQPEPILKREMCLRLPQRIVARRPDEISIPIPPVVREIIENYRPPKKY